MNVKIVQADEKLTQAQKQKVEVAGQIEQNTLAAAQIASDISSLETGIRALHPRLPPPLAEKIRTLYERMPADTNNVRVSVAERCQNVLGILNEINKFNAEIAMVYDVRNLSDGKPSEVSCVYVGLGQARLVPAVVLAVLHQQAPPRVHRAAQHGPSRRAARTCRTCAR
jgi:hypothetical protein